MALACALLLGQLLLVVHATEHTWHRDRPVCSLCVHAHAAAGAPPAMAMGMPRLRMEQATFALHSLLAETRAYVHGARAPPL